MKLSEYFWYFLKGVAIIITILILISFVGGVFNNNVFCKDKGYEGANLGLMEPGYVECHKLVYENHKPTQQYETFNKNDKSR